MLRNAFIGLMTSLMVIVTIGFFGLHHNKPQYDREEVAMTSLDRDYLLMVLKKKSADDCIIEQAAYGWKCTDFKGRVYKVIRDERKIKTARTNSFQH